MSELKFDLESWLVSRPYWEKKLWSIALAEGKLNDQKLNFIFSLLLEDFNLSEKVLERGTININNVQSMKTDSDEGIHSIRILEIKNLKNVNALPSDQTLTLGKQLTLIYGENGSGKSGYSRLFSSCCFSRGDKTILPNLRETKATNSTKASADIKLIIGDEEKTIAYIEDNKHEMLQRFSVFDSSSVQIHINNSSSVTIAPIQLKLFEYVIEAFNELERKLEREKISRKSQSPIHGRFEGDSEISDFCSKLDHLTSIDKLNKWEYTQTYVDRTEEIKVELQMLRKLDVESRKKQLNMELTEMQDLYEKLGEINSIINNDNVTTSISYINEVLQKTELSKQIGESSFSDDLFMSIGSEEWKSLLRSAKVLLESEQLLNEHFILTKCPLCKQTLKNEEQSLFQRYWSFLEGKSQNELNIAKQNVETHKKKFSIEFPKLDMNSLVGRIIDSKDVDYFEYLNGQLIELSSKRDLIKEKIEKCESESYPAIQPLLLEKLNTLISEIKKQIEEIGNPEEDIKKLETELLFIVHIKIFTQIKSEIIAYVRHLSWHKACEKVSFPKRQVTTKQRELFDEIVTDDYRRKFSEECQALECNFGVSVITKGASGSTVKELRLDITSDYKMGKILSEGEQRVCALADFLTEVSLDKGNCGIIFDDPVTSLDHLRKRKIAERLVAEASKRQVIILTHDKVFLSYLAEISEELLVSYEAHWIQRVGNKPGKISLNSSPKLATLSLIVQDVDRIIATVGAGLVEDDEQQQRKLAECFSLMRSACEALIEQVMFNKTIQRHDDYIRVNNLLEVPWDDSKAVQITELHGKLSRYIEAHNRSDYMREEPMNVDLAKTLRREFVSLRDELMGMRKNKKAQLEKRKFTSPW